MASNGRPSRGDDECHDDDDNDGRRPSPRTNDMSSPRKAAPLQVTAASGCSGPFESINNAKHRRDAPLPATSDEERTTDAVGRPRGGLHGKRAGAQCRSAHHFSRASFAYVFPPYADPFPACFQHSGGLRDEGPGFAGPRTARRPRLHQTGWQCFPRYEACHRDTKHYQCSRRYLNDTCFRKHDPAPEGADPRFPSAFPLRKAALHPDHVINVPLFTHLLALGTSDTRNLCDGKLVSFRRRRARENRFFSEICQGRLKSISSLRTALARAYHTWS